uniref:DUF1771 domain-containing protein n=1 Tax=Nelumbo nucifera TaxID=4432 RepID=A0A823A0S5_NELNU|nr:TPA_asm: hypothetical protein HUJ06_019102 [Nelumbo nucifera]
MLISISALCSPTKIHSFEQARQAYLIGNKALAKELSAKGQLHNAHMKAAHEKAQEAIYRQRLVLSNQPSEDFIAVVLHTWREKSCE